MLNVRITEIDDNQNEINTILSTRTITTLEIYLKRCMELSQEKNRRYKVELSLQRRLNKPSEQEIYNTFIVDKDYQPTDYIRQFLSKEF